MKQTFGTISSRMHMTFLALFVSLLGAFAEIPNTDPPTVGDLASHEPAVRLRALHRFAGRYRNADEIVFRPKYPWVEALPAGEPVPNEVVSRICFMATNDLVLEIRKDCIWALHEMRGRTNIWPILQSYIDSSDTRVADYAAWTIARDAADRLENSKPSDPFQESATRYVVKRTGLLLTQIENKDQLRRGIHYAKALGGHAKEHLPEIKRLTSHPDKAVCKKAEEALKEITKASE